MNYCPYNDRILCPYAPPTSDSGIKACLTPATKCDEWREQLKGSGYFSSPIFLSKEFAMMKKELEEKVNKLIEENEISDNPIGSIDI